MRWLAVLAVGLLLTACGSGEVPEEASQNAASTGIVDKTDKKAVTETAPAGAEADPKTEAEPDVAKVAPVSETGDEEVAETETTSSVESLKLAALPGSVTVPGFKEGVHYRRLVPVQPTGAAVGMVQVAEVFSYGCKPCFDIDAKVDAWRAKHKPAYVTFERLPAITDNTQRFQARAFYIAEQLGKLDTLHAALFAEIQAGAAMSDSAALSKFLIAREIDQRTIATVLKSKEVEVNVARASDLQRRYRVDSLPFFVVGGKYVTTVAMAGDDDKLLALLTQLSIREHEF